MELWEYKVENWSPTIGERGPVDTAGFENHLNTLGAQGWELMSITNWYGKARAVLGGYDAVAGETTVVFKRPFTRP